MRTSTSQKALLHVAKAKLAWDDETYRQVLVRIAGVTTSKDLDQEGFAAVMGFAEYCGFKPLGKGAPRYGDRPGMATFAQLGRFAFTLNQNSNQIRLNSDACKINKNAKPFRGDPRVVARSAGRAHLR